MAHFHEVRKTTEWKDHAIDFIADFEWYRECSYWDFKHWSIGYGTASRQWECITREEAMQRKKEHLHAIFNLVDLECYNDNQKIAMTSYVYNTGGYQLWLRGIIQRCDTAWVLYVMRNWGWSANWRVLPWLAKRRNIEINKFNSL